jgi:hypothetical protein
LAKDYPKPPWVNECIAQGKLILQGGLVAKIGAHESKASNLLKLNCKINDKIVGCLLDPGMTNSFMIPQVAEQLGVKIELVVDPIIVQLAQGIVRPSLSVVLRVELFCERVRFFENFTLCDLNNFDVIPGNTFLDAYKVDILCSEGKLKVCANSGFKLVNLYVDYNLHW